MIKTLENGTVVLEAKVLKVYPTIQKWWWFEVKKIKVEFPSGNEDFPHRVLIEQSWNKIPLADNLVEWKEYKFYIDFKTNDRKDTTFWTITAWKIEPLEEWDDNWNLPF